MAARKGNCRSKILDSAEKLFAERGFDATSIRDVVAESGDTLGTLSHHFGTKNNLLRAVIERRFADLDAMRKQRYDDIVGTANGQPLDLSQVAEAILLPFVQQAFGPDAGWRSYTQLMGRMVRTSDATHRQFVSNLRDPYTERYLSWLREALPCQIESELRYAYDLMISVMIGASSDVQHLDLATTQCRQSIVDNIAPRLLAFVTAGIKAMLTYQSPGLGQT